MYWSIVQPPTKSDALPVTRYTADRPQLNSIQNLWLKWFFTGCWLANMFSTTLDSLRQCVKRSDWFFPFYLDMFIWIWPESLSKFNLSTTPRKGIRVSDSLSNFMSRIETGNEGSTKAKELAYPILFIATLPLHSQYRAI